MECLTACPLGEYGGDSTCTPCPNGKYGAQQGGTEDFGCSICEPGTFASQGAITCSSCADFDESGERKWSQSGSAVCLFVCTRGDRINSLETYSCTRCEPGKFNLQPGGFFESVGVNTCGVCDAGYYCTGGDSRVPCPPGRHGNSPGRDSLDDCTPCPIGTFSKSRGLASEEDCTQCFPGTVGVSVGAGATTKEEGCEECPAGRSAAFEDATCTPCGNGTVASSSKAAFCEVCPQGFYANDDRTDCLECPAGSQCSAGIKAPCALGEVSEAAQSNCNVCESGLYANEAKTQCLTCSAGSQCTDGERTPCAQGELSEAGQAYCTKCEPGTVPDLNGNSCVDCNPGYSAAYGENACAPCTNGTIAANGRAAFCVVCPQGEYANSAKTACLECPAGSQCSAGIQTQCAPGEISDTGQSNCEVCEPGFRTDTAANACVECTPGTYSSDGSECVPCDGEGEYSSSAGAIYCLTAPAGFKPNAARTDQEPCPVNTFSIGGKNNCTPCASGFSEPGSAACTACLPGYSTNIAAKTCDECAPGTYSSDGTECLPCDGEGEYSSSTRAIYCLTAPAGFKPNTARTDQEPCPVNTFSIGASDDCTPCESGFSDIGSASCTACLPGYKTDSQSEKCMICTAGTFSPDGVACQSCDGPGEYSSEEGAVFCSTATAGFKANEARTAAEECPKNTYSEGASYECLPCDSGFSEPGSAACTPCLPGYYTDIVEEECAICAAGKYSANGSECQPCDGPGEFSAENGSFYCSTCNPGTAVNADNTACVPCAPGTARSFDEDRCGTCEVGTVAPFEGSAYCELCLAGTKSNDASTECEACEPGRKSSAGNDTCIECDVGSYAKADGTDCIPCPAGRFGDAKGLSDDSCSGDCPAGTYALRFSSQCIDCEAGKFAVSPGTEDCDLCKETEGFTSSSGAAECVCAAGRYLDPSGECERCSEGMQCSSIGTDVGILAVEDGFWRQSDTTTTVLKCPFPDACVGTNGSACAIGNEGVLCAVCSDGYYRRSNFDECSVMCKSQSASIASTIAIVACMIVAVVCIVYVNRKAPDSMLRPFIELVQRISVMLLFSAPFPASVVKVGRVLSALSLGFELASPQCAGFPSDFYAMFGYAVVALSVLSFAMFLPMIKAKIRSPSIAVMKTEVAAVCFRDFFVVVLLLHPSVSGKAMEFFRCRKIEGTWYLMADYSLECYDARWWSYLVLVLLVLLVFTVGTPVSIAYVLYQRRDSLYDDDGKPTRQPLDILFAVYKQRAYWYESVLMTFKLALWSALVFFEYGTAMQLATALVVNVMQLCVHIYVLPMGGEEAALQNGMLTATLMLTTYINFGALSMNYLDLSKNYAELRDESERIDAYDRSIRTISVIMEVLFFGIILSYTAVALSRIYKHARNTTLDDFRSLASKALARLPSLKILRTAATSSSRFSSRNTRSEGASAEGTLSTQVTANPLGPDTPRDTKKRDEGGVELTKSGESRESEPSADILPEV